VTTIGHRHILVAIEGERGHDAPAGGNRPALLERSAAEQALTLVAEELARIMPGIGRCALSMAAALYDQTQILRPGMPVFAALQDLQASASPGEGFAPRLLSIGASRGRMPHRALQPETDTPPSALSVLPLLVSGPADAIDGLSAAMEERFLENGDIEADARTRLGSLFRVEPAHARFMTITDLNALLRLQLELFGFLPLWELLDAAVNPRQRGLSVSTDSGLEFACEDGVVHSYFETFDWWAAAGAGKNTPADEPELQNAYADWTREYRRYITTLSAHGVAVEQHPASRRDAELTEGFLLEHSARKPGEEDAPVTEHSLHDLGTVAVTVVSGGRQMNFYPLRADGLGSLHDYIRAQGYAGDTAFPGRLCVDVASRRLQADTL
jgi:hypothetical protein